MLYKINKKAVEVLMKLFDAPVTGMIECPGYKQYKLSRQFIRNYSLHPLMRLRVAKNIDLNGDKFYLQIPEYSGPSGKHTIFHIGNWFEVKNQFQYEENPPKNKTEIPSVEVIIFVSHDHATCGSAHTFMTIITEPFYKKEGEGLYNHWVNRYIWIIPNDETKIIAEVNRERHGDQIFLGSDTLNVKNESALYLAPSYGIKIEKIV